MAFRVWKEIGRVGQCIPFKRRYEQKFRFEMENRGSGGGRGRAQVGGYVLLVAWVASAAAPTCLPGALWPINPNQARKATQRPTPLGIMVTRRGSDCLPKQSVLLS
jgi:hypothetical protein